MSTGYCCQCKRVLSLDNFYITASGKQYSWCRTCKRAKARVVYAKIKTRERFKEKHRRGSTKYRNNNPEKAKAHTLANNNRSELLEPQCSACGSAERLHMHHPDYSKPLEVITLCVPCHSKQHHKEYA